jgi:hypothetical protein
LIYLDPDHVSEEGSAWLASQIEGKIHSFLD